MTGRNLPTGTVTFLFSDMEGSTRLVQDLGPAVFTQVLEQHNAILREAFSGHGGVERGTQGDSFLVMFPEAPAAASAAAEAQVALAEATWAADAPVRVRMGLHTGIGTLGGDDYVSVDVNRAARIAALAHGGQVLISDATRALVEGALPAGVSMRPLGEFELKDLARPERLHQLVIDGVRSEFPPLRPIDRPIGNLPDHLTSFIGRVSELVELGSLVREKRLVTLTGPGGTGKTRLAIELARRAAGQFEHGAWLVPLDAISDPELVPAAIASSFALVESPGSTPSDRLARYLADREMLLVLDNFEHVIDAAPRDHASCSRRRPGCTCWSRAAPRSASRSSRNIPSRRSACPAPDDRSDDALASESVRLFVERAGRVRPGSRCPIEDAAAVAEICQRLDGLPLGIELAASRIGLLPPRALASRLSQQLDVPGGKSRDLPARQQTLERAIAWSYDLLDAPSQRLLARLSVFAGGFRLEEAEAVGGPADELGIEVIEGLTTLADHSLVQPMAGPDLPRFRLLETIRRCSAPTRLAESGEREAIQRRHATAYLALAEEAATYMPGRDQVPVARPPERGPRQPARRHGLGDRDRRGRDRPPAARRRSGGSGSSAATSPRDANERPRSSRCPAPTVRPPGGCAGWTPQAGSRGGAATSREPTGCTKRRLTSRASSATSKGWPRRCSTWSHTRFVRDAGPGGGAPIFRPRPKCSLGRLGTSDSLTRLNWSGGYAHMAQGELAEAEQIARDTLPRSVASGDEYYIALAATALGGIAFAKGDLDGAVDLGIRGLLASSSMGDVASVTLSLEACAALFSVAGMPAEAVTIEAAYEAHGRRYGVQPPLDVDAWLGLGSVIEAIRADLQKEEYAEQVRLGSSMTTEGVLEFLVREAIPRLKARARIRA